MPRHEKKRICFEKIFKFKYSFLLLFLMSLIVISPLIVQYPLLHFFIVSFLFILIIAAMLAVLKAGTTLLLASATLAFLAILFDFLETFVVKGKWVGIATLSAYFLYVGIAIIFLLRKVFSEKAVTGDTIQGGISIYVLAGLLWQIIYHSLWVINPHSFNAVGKGTAPPNFFYFSFTTMTTLGYGDILPVSYVAKTAAMLQAMVGQIYLAVFVARLVGLHTAKSSNQR
jgi:hypothetical protein